MALGISMDQFLKKCSSTMSISPEKSKEEKIAIITLYLFLIVFVCLFILLIIFTNHDVPKINITSIRVSPNVCDSNATAKWDFEFLVRNPNKLTAISYDPITVTAYSGGEFILGAVTVPFYQPTKAESSLSAAAFGWSPNFNTTNASGGATVVDPVVTVIDVEFHFAVHYDWRGMRIGGRCSNVKIGFASINSTSLTMLERTTWCFQRISDHF